MARSKPRASGLAKHLMSNDAHYTAEEKLAILSRHLLDRVPISSLCEELGLQKAVFYRWQKEFFENGAAAFLAKQRSSRQTGTEGETD